MTCEQALSEMVWTIAGILIIVLSWVPLIKCLKHRFDMWNIKEDYGRNLRE